MVAAQTFRWTWIWSAFAWLTLVVAVVLPGSRLIAAAAGIALFGTVFAAVYHAEVIAHRVGEPFGTLVLAVAVGVIETALIVSVMLADPVKNAGLARDTVFAAVMIVCNGMIGLCLLVGGARYHEQGFQIQGASAALAVLTALTGLTLVIPNYAASELGPLYSNAQLIFAGSVSLTLYGAFVFVQTVRHRGYFLPVEPGDEEAHVPPPPVRAAILSFGLLLVSLVAVVGLAKMLTPTVEAGVTYLGVPSAVIGIVIAALVLLPEGLAATNAAARNRLQTSLNLALGSTLATIGLTIPAVAAVSIVVQRPLVLGLDAKDQVLLALTLLISAITFSTGRTTVLQGIVHLIIFVVFLFFAVVP